jgi:hypothetical protein
VGKIERKRVDSFFEMGDGDIYVHKIIKTIGKSVDSQQWLVLSPLNGVKISELIHDTFGVIMIICTHMCTLSVLPRENEDQSYHLLSLC